MKKKTGQDMTEGYDDLLKGSGANREAVQAEPGPAEGEAEESVDIGTRIKAARKNRGLSVFDVYLRTDIDVEQLSQIEAGKTIPPLGTVVKLAKAFDLEMGYFISGQGAEACTIVRREDRQTTSRYDSKKEKRHGYQYESLAPRKTDRRMEPFLVTLKPSATEEERSTHDGQEFIFVLQGKMEVRLGEEIHILETGDSIYYDSTVPHLVKCHGPKPTKILAVLYTGK